MKRVAIISSSVRTGRLSHRVALYIKRYLEGNALAEVDLLDLKAYDFPLFDERFAFQEHPSEKLVDFTERFNRAQVVWIVTPVYNGSFPASLKNVIDLYYKEWKRKVAVVTSVTYTKVPPILTIQQLQVILLKLGALVIPAMHTVIEADKDFDPDGNPRLPDQADAFLRPVADETLWLADRVQK